mmetsp:Transcript_25026/g.17692  ORF Transcript_25026/g.17692 Transcript_25026/m.17692 type:complete len:105 (-) Transcript_25026:1318-1632(-)
MLGNKNLHQTYYCDGIAEKTEYKCNNFTDNASLIVFYILFCIYFIISAIHIRFGMPSLKKGGFMMDKYQPINSYIFRGFLAIPFIFELRSIVDWTFTKTALDVF